MDRSLLRSKRPRPYGSMTLLSMVTEEKAGYLVCHNDLGHLACHKSMEIEVEALVMGLEGAEAEEVMLHFPVESGEEASSFRPIPDEGFEDDFEAERTGSTRTLCADDSTGLSMALL